MNTNTGFTLVELLVSVTIIAVLSTIGVTGFQAVTRSGRDALRKSDLEQIRSALEIYKSQNGFYPDATTECVPNLSSDYIKTIPNDPKSASQNYCYVKLTNLSYELCGHLENGDASDNCIDGGGSSLCGSNCNYQVVNP
jgi:general secretion pathway protein G